MVSDLHCCAVPLVGFLFSSSWAHLCAACRKIPLLPESLVKKDPAPALRSSPLQSYCVGREAHVAHWPFSRMWESDRSLFCLGVGLFLHEEKQLVSSPVEIQAQERHQTACDHSSFSRDHNLHHDTTKASHSIKHILEKSSGHWQITNEREHASGPEQAILNS